MVVGATTAGSGSSSNDPYLPLKEEFAALLRHLGVVRDGGSGFDSAEARATEAWANGLLFGMSQARGVYNHRL